MTHYCRHCNNLDDFKRRYSESYTESGTAYGWAYVDSDDEVGDQEQDDRDGNENDSDNFEFEGPALCCRCGQEAEEIPEGEWNRLDRLQNPEAYANCKPDTKQVDMEKIKQRIIGGTK